MDVWIRAGLRSFWTWTWKILLTLALLAGTAVSFWILGFNNTIQSTQWAPIDPQPALSGGIAVLGSSHTPISDQFRVVDDPSLDLTVSFDSTDEPKVSGMFRINFITTADNDGAAQVGLVLPLHSTFVAGGPGPDDGLSMTVLYVGASPSAQFSCDPTLFSSTIADARKIEGILSGAIEWSVDCEPYGAIVWTHLPTQSDNSDGGLSSTGQRMVTKSAAMVSFQLPAYAGISRTSYDTWSFKASLETGRILDGHETQPLSTLLPTIDPVFSITPDASSRVMNPSPWDFTVKERTYLKRTGTVWQREFDGEVYPISADIQSTKLAAIEKFYTDYTSYALAYLTSGFMGLLGWTIARLVRKRKIGLHAKL